MLATIGGNFGVDVNWSLTSFSLPVLTTVGGDFSVSENTLLKVCLVQAIVDQLVDFMGTTTITDNDDTGTCP